MADTTVTVKDHICALFEAERRTTALLLEERNRRYAELRAADSEALHAAFAAQQTAQAAALAAIETRRTSIGAIAGYVIGALGLIAAVMALVTRP